MINTFLIIEAIIIEILVYIGVSSMIFMTTHTRMSL